MTLQLCYRREVYRHSSHLAWTTLQTLLVPSDEALIVIAMEMRTLIP